REVLEHADIKEITLNMVLPVVERIVKAHTPDDQVPEEWDLAAIADYANTTFLQEGQLTADELWGKERDEMIELVQDKVKALYDQREQEMGEETMREFEKVVVLRAVDSKWMDHIDAMEQLRQGIHLRAYGGTDPLREYQFEGFEMFKEMIESIQEEVTKYIMKAHVEANLERQVVAEGQAVDPKIEAEGKKPAKAEEKIGRNDLCPCGSGKKFKQCHGK
ncbi:MAG: secA, partial [Paenibacillus sp.]|nr:secA [Paenibacillus sp.]